MSTNQRSHERELDAWLSRTLQSHGEYIEDEGFTDGVMVRLPGHATRPWRWRLGVLFLALLSGLLAMAVVPVQPLVAALASVSVAVPVMPLLQVGGALLASVLLAAGYWIWKEA